MHWVLRMLQMMVLKEGPRWTGPDQHGTCTDAQSACNLLNDDMQCGVMYSLACAGYLPLFIWCIAHSAPDPPTRTHVPLALMMIDPS